MWVAEAQLLGACIWVASPECRLQIADCGLSQDICHLKITSQDFRTHNAVRCDCPRGGLTLSHDASQRRRMQNAECIVCARGSEVPSQKNGDFSFLHIVPKSAQNPCTLVGLGERLQNLGEREPGDSRETENADCITENSPCYPFLYSKSPSRIGAPTYVCEGWVGSFLTQFHCTFDWLGAARKCQIDRGFQFRRDMPIPIAAAACARARQFTSRSTVNLSAVGPFIWRVDCLAVKGQEPATRKQQRGADLLRAHAHERGT